MSHRETEGRENQAEEILVTGKIFRYLLRRPGKLPHWPIIPKARLVLPEVLPFPAGRNRLSLAGQSPDHFAIRRSLLFRCCGGIPYRKSRKMPEMKRPAQRIEQGKTRTNRQI